MTSRHDAPSGSGFPSKFFEALCGKWVEPKLTQGMQSADRLGFWRSTFNAIAGDWMAAHPSDAIVQRHQDAKAVAGPASERPAVRLAINHDELQVRRPAKGTQPTRARVFINYRAADDPFAAALVHEALARRLGAEYVFRDAMSVRVGETFESAIWTALNESVAIVVIIGPRWLTVSTDDHRRIDDPGDFVRREIAEALNRNLLVIPVLVNDAVMPRRHELPADIAGLASRQYIRLNSRNIDPQLGELADQLSGLLESSQRRGDVDLPEAMAILRQRADSGDRSARLQLAVLLRDQGAVEELRARADAGDREAASQLATLLRGQGAPGEAAALLRNHAAQGDQNAALQLAVLLRDEGDPNEAEAILRERAQSGDVNAVLQLAEVLQSQGKSEEAVVILRERVQGGDSHAALKLAELLQSEGKTEEAIEVLLGHARSGDIYVRSLIELLRS